MFTKLSTLIERRARGRAIIALLLAFVVFEALTLPPLQHSPGGTIAPLDTLASYSPEQAFATVDSYGDARPFWILVYLTWDTLNPILYGLLLSLLISWLLQRSSRPLGSIRHLNLLPLAAGSFDLLENLSIVILLATHPAFIPLIAQFASIASTAKSAFLGLSVLTALTVAVSATVTVLKKGSSRNSDAA